MPTQVPANPTPEQIAELEEKIKKMSPEELREFQKSQCIFCQIVDGKVQAKKIYDDNIVLAVLDINPANPGHMLIMPKEHYMIMPQIPDEKLAHTFNVVKNLSQTSLRVLEADGSNIIVANGAVAGQRAQHFMVHLIPRKEGDNISFSLPQKPHSEQELAAVKDEMYSAMTGTKKKTETPAVIRMEAKKDVEADFKEDKKMIEKENVKRKAIKKEENEINIDEIAKLFSK